MRIKKDDYVEVIAGADKGKRGKVLRVLPKKNKVVVEGIRYVFRHLKKSQQHPKGGRIQKEAPIDVSNVMLFSPHSQEPTRLGYRYETPEGQENDPQAKKTKLRYCKKTGKPILGSK